MPAVSSTPGQAAVDPDRLADRILGGWLGRIAGCNLGKPVEDGDFWTPERIRSYLELADAYPLRDYIPALDPMPADYRFQDCWLETTRGRIAGSARDDDIDYAIIAVWLLEQYGHNLDRSDVAAAMLAFLPYLRVFTAERAAMVNLLHRLPVERVAEVRNPYREWIGALIRVDVYGWTCPGRPEDAIRLAYADATLTHRSNGVYGAYGPLRWSQPRVLPRRYGRRLRSRLATPHQALGWPRRRGLRRLLSRRELGGSRRRYGWPNRGSQVADRG